MGFYDSMQGKINNQKTFTDNGAVAYLSSGKKLLDFNFSLSAMRDVSSKRISDEFMLVFNEDPVTAVEYLFYLGDVREGIGERKAFRACLEYVINYHPELAKAVLELIPFYNRWDSILCMLDNEKTKDCAIKFLKRQIKSDKRNIKNGNAISLCAKWMPSINASSKITVDYAKTIVDGFGWTNKKYRKTLSKLRRYLNVVEVNMSAKEWSKIDYEKVPSKANLIYNNAFLRNDTTRRQEFLRLLNNNEVKINASALQPHEIVSKVKRQYSIDDTLEALWKNLPDLSVENTLVVRDGSGSMTWGSSIKNATPLDVATALAIYMSEHNTGDWKDKFVTFSSNPKIVNLSKCKSLYEKVMLSLREADCSNTNIYRTMELILETAKDNNIAEKDMPKMIVICSDMQFDARGHNFNDSLFDTISKEYKDAGYELPRICFWNLSGKINNTVPMQQNKHGLILCSGFSVQLLRMFMSNQTDPYKILLETLHSERYDKVREVINGLV